MSNLNESARPEPGTSYVPGPTSLPVTVAFGQLPPFGPPATMRWRWAEQLLRGDVIEGLRDRWAVVAHVIRTGPDVILRVQEARGSRTAAYGARQRGFGMRSDIRVAPSTIPDIPDGFPPRWGVWREGLAGEVTLAWHPEPGKAAEHARQASRDGDEYVVELEAPDGSVTQVDAYQRGRRSTWGKHLAERLSRTGMPPWATPGNDGTAGRAAGPPVCPAGSDDPGQGKAPAGRACAPGPAGTSFPAGPQTGPLTAPSGPGPDPAQKHSPDQVPRPEAKTLAAPQDRELREVRATDQAIRAQAGRPW
jgi:hypothetical protein